MLVKSAVRYLPNRNAVQTVYWRTAKDINGNIHTAKQTKLCHFGPKDDKIKTGVVVNEITEYYSPSRFTIVKSVPT